MKINFQYLRNIFAQICTKATIFIFYRINAKNYFNLSSLENSKQTQFFLPKITKKWGNIFTELVFWEN